MLRDQVQEPLLTGITAVDTLAPLGKVENISCVLCCAVLYDAARLLCSVVC